MNIVIHLVALISLPLILNAAEKTKTFEEFKKYIDETEKKKFEQYEPEVFSTRLVEKAKTGDLKAQCDLGYRYLNGEGVTRNKAEGLNWLYIAASKGDKWAQLWYGVEIDSDDGLVEYETCKRFLVNSASQDNQIALSQLKLLTSINQKQVESQRFPRKYNNCKYLDHEQNTGDTFFVSYEDDFSSLKDKEARLWIKLYAVKCLETNELLSGEEMGPSSGILNCSHDCKKRLAKLAKEKVSSLLKDKSFTIYTKMEPARPKDCVHKTAFYSVIKYDQNIDLAAELLKEGLAFRNGPCSNIPIPLGNQSSDKLKKEEELAKTNSKGIWEFFSEKN